ncbi:MAG: hypothetical protein H0W66_04565, partial [Chthoniobacterales bacterium]|nr:hypothetical protein [Chthoniobacterales bacterium]
MFLAIALMALGLAPSLFAGPVQTTDDKSKAVAMAPAPDWREFAISPVSNPIFFEDPRIRTEARFVFLYNRVSDDFSINVGGTDINLGGADI